MSEFLEMAEKYYAVAQSLRSQAGYLTGVAEFLERKADSYCEENIKLHPQPSVGEHPGGGPCIHVWSLTNRSAIENGKCGLCGNEVTVPETACAALA
jgi:hypothetical protein